MNNFRIERYSPEQIKFFKYYLICYSIISICLLSYKPNNYINLWYFTIYIVINGFITTLLTPVSFIYKSIRYFNLSNIFLNIIFITLISMQNTNALIYYYNNIPALIFYLLFMFFKFIYLYIYILKFKIEQNQYMPVSV